MLGQYGYVGLYLLVAIGFPVAGLLASKVIRPKHPTPTKATTYECGMVTAGPAWGRFHSRYYLLALLFVVFDVEAVFLFPWAVAYGKLALFGLIEMLVFIGILAIGLAYAWKKRALEWR